MPPKKKTPAKAAPETDPLADLRQEWGGPDAMEAPEPTQETEADQEAVSVPLTTEEQRAEMAALIIAAWHADPVAKGFLHRGHRCGCRYLTRVALDASAPAQPEEEQEPEEGTTDGD